MSGESPGDNQWVGARITSQFSTAAETDYEEKQLTYGPYEWPSVVMLGVYSSSSNAAEGFWIKDQVARLDEAYGSSAIKLMLSQKTQTGDTIKNSDSFTERKTRLGGRIK